jgi:16S rRNA (adenine1518-N6/adenine1519-N6)-dimethyltransferase
LGLRDIRAVLERHGLHLSRELGQNFLVEDQQAERLAALAGIGAGDSVIEVGTGLGVLTRAIASRAGRVVSIEIDAGVVRALRQEALLPPNVELRHADALDVDFAELAASLPRPVRLVANLPYSVATPILRRMLDLREVFADWSVMIQREVAQRLVAKPGSKAYGSLSVIHALTVDVETCAVLPPGAFFPPPRVESSFLRIWPRVTPLVEAGALAGVERVTRAAFSQRRKTISNALRGSGFAIAAEPGDVRSLIDAALREAGIEPGARAETVEAERYVELAAGFVSRGWIS